MTPEINRKKLIDALAPYAEAARQAAVQNPVAEWVTQQQANAPWRPTPQPAAPPPPHDVIPHSKAPLTMGEVISDLGKPDVVAKAGRDALDFFTPTVDWNPPPYARAERGGEQAHALGYGAPSSYNQPTALRQPLAHVIASPNQAPPQASDTDADDEGWVLDGADRPDVGGTNHELQRILATLDALHQRDARPDDASLTKYVRRP